jgi:hypothetical protein
MTHGSVTVLAIAPVDVRMSILVTFLIHIILRNIRNNLIESGPSLLKSFSEVFPTQYSLHTSTLFTFSAVRVHQY